MFEQAQIQEFKEVGVAVPSPDEGHPTGEMTCMPRLIQTVCKPLNKHLVLVTSIDYQKKKKIACRPPSPTLPLAYRESSRKAQKRGGAGEPQSPTGNLCSVLIPTNTLVTCVLRSSVTPVLGGEGWQKDERQIEGRVWPAPGPYSPS